MKKCRHPLEAGAGAAWRRVARCRSAVRARADIAVPAGRVGFVLALALALAVPGASAASFEPDAAVRAAGLALVQQAAAALAPPGARITASAGALDPRLRLAPCARVEPYLVAGLPIWGATRVGLRCMSGPVAWRAYLPVRVQVLASAWTSKAALPSGALVATDQWELAETDWAAAASLPLGASAAIAGRTLARPVHAGQALREADLLARRWFAIGQTVRIVASGPGFSIQTDGQALGHGIEGQPVRVRTEGGRIVSGQPVGEALVQVQP